MVSVQGADAQKNSDSDIQESLLSAAQPELLEIPDSHILLNSSNYTANNGLSQNTVTAIAKDKNSFLWIGTVNGLNRFDGIDFKTYLIEDGLPSPFIRTIFINDSGKLYVGTDRGLAYYDEKKDAFKRIKLGSNQNKTIWKIKPYKNIILFSTSDSVIALDKNEKSKELYRSSNLIDIKDFVKSESSIYIRNYDKNLLKINGKNIVLIKDNVESIAAVGEKLYFSTQNGLFLTDLNSTKNHIAKLNNLSYQHLQVYKKKLYGLSNDLIHNLSDLVEIGRLYNSHKYISFMVSDGFYLGTLDDGLIVSTNANNLITKFDSESASVWGMTKKDERIYISTSAEKINVYDINLNHHSTINTGINGYKYLANWEENIVIGSSKGLFIIEPHGKQKQLLQTPITYLNKIDDTLYVGTENGNIFIIRDIKKLNSIFISPNTSIYHIEENNYGLFISTSNGLYSSIDSKITKIDNQAVYQSCTMEDTLIYGTNSSILKLNLKINTTENIIKTDKFTFALKCLDNGFLVATQNQLLFNLNNQSYTLSKNNGSSMEYNAAPILEVKDRLLIAGTNGINFFNLKKINNFINKNTTPVVNITSLLVFNELIKKNNNFYSGSLNKDSKITLKHSDYPFTLKFSALDKNVTYKYQLHGLDDAWITAYKNSSTFTNLTHGNYVFKVKAIDLLTRYESPIKTIQIEILPPWWLTVYAKMLYTFSTICFVFLIIRAVTKKKQIQRQIATSEERLKLSLWGSGDEMWDWDIETGQIYRSNMWESLDFPVVGQRTENENQRSNIHPMDRKRVHQHLEDHLQDKTEHFEISYRVKSKDNKWIWILDRAKVVVRNNDGTPIRMTGTIKNINDFKNTEEQLKLFGKAIENISEGMFILDHSFIFVELNQACVDITQTNKQDYLGKRLQFDQYPDNYSRQIRKMLRNHGRWANEVDVKRGDGSSFTMDLTIDAIYDDNGNTSHYVAVFSDVSLRKQHEVELQKMSTSDALTGLPNRSFLQVTLSNLVKRQVANVLMILDIDNFKKINDSLGHNVGDELLQMVTQRIITAVEGEAGIYRLGGDEFAILIESHPDIAGAAALANRIIDTFKAPIEIKKTKLVVGASIGIVFYPDDEENEQAILRKAEVAMYSAKSAGGNRYHFYSESQNSNAIRQLEVENLIREGLANDYFEVYYQSKVDVKTNKVAGMEALVRLIHPEYGMISPAEFIPLAEETGLIVELGDIVLEKACRATQKWRLENDFSGRVAVNLSSRQFALPDLQQRIQHILDETGLPAENLEIEITESTVITNPERAIKVMERLTHMGIHLALDDFGTGYSSLSYLKRFPIHCLKIDKAFIDDIDKSDRDLKMVDSIITIAHNMGLSVVAEGVEEQSQLGILRALKCEQIQGYLFCKPLPSSEFQAQLK